MGAKTKWIFHTSPGTRKGDLCIAFYARDAHRIFRLSVNRKGVALLLGKRWQAAVGRGGVTPRLQKDALSTP